MNNPLKKVEQVNSLTAFKERLADIAEQKAGLDREAKVIESELMTRYQANVADLYKAKGEQFGTVNLDIDGEVMSITTPKKVAWDQSKLAAIWEEIRASGSDPSEYMTVEYTVPESKYKAWPEVITKQFDPARTVAPGRAKVAFKEGEAQ